MQTMATFMPPPPAATFLAFHPQDNNILAIGMDDSTVQIYNVRVDEVYSIGNVLCIVDEEIAVLSYSAQICCRLRVSSRAILKE